MAPRSTPPHNRTKGNLQQETVDATATSRNHAAITQLTSMVERLTAELVTVNTKLVAALHTK